VPTLRRLAPPIRRRGTRRIGLLGGSFNPAHDGHRHVSLLALHRLELDEVWWLVSPQNPLKPIAGMAPFAGRLAEARRVANHPRIHVTDIEADLGTAYTADTLPKLLRRFPGVRFVWLMGADNLVQIDRWRDWRTIFGTLAIAVFDRPHYSLRALACKAARRFRRARLKESQAGALADVPPPAWVFLRTRLNATSATAIRARRGAKPWTGARGRGRRSGLGATRDARKRRRTP
jgi:nicotinate-nucleotide adenylyltransferase